MPSILVFDSRIHELGITAYETVRQRCLFPAMILWIPSKRCNERLAAVTASGMPESVPAILSAPGKALAAERCSQQASAVSWLECTRSPARASLSLYE